MEDKGKNVNTKSGETNILSASVLQKFTNFIDRNIYYIRYTSYGLAAIGVIMIGRSIHVTRKFYSAKDIPTKFITGHVRLNGKIKSVDNTGIINVDHIPIVNMKYSRHHPKGSENLRISLGGVELLDTGLMWLHEKLPGRVVKFRMLTLSANQVLPSIVTTKKGIFRNDCINETLIREGLAKASHIEGMPNDPTYNKLCTRLLKAEMYAEKKGKGVWTKPTIKEIINSAPKNMTSNMVSFFKDKFTIFKSKRKRES